MMNTNAEIVPPHSQNKIKNLQQIVESSIDDHGKQQILFILEKISALKPHERLLLYMRMPTGTPETDPLRQSQNPLGTRYEINHTINWVKTHLEHDPNVSIPKQDVYDDYVIYCSQVNIKPLSTADFGKVMKQIFPDIRPRRLGTRGNSRYCYAALRKSTKLAPPRLPDIVKPQQSLSTNSCNDDGAMTVIKSWMERLLNMEFDNCKDLADYISANNFKSLDSNNFRMMLPKEIRAKKKANVINALKKRKKKKNRKSFSLSENVSITSTTITVTEPNASSVIANAAITSNNSPSNANTEIKLVDQISLTDTADQDIKLMIKSEIDDTSSTSSSASMPITCKKVRQANQHKQNTSAQQIQSATTATPANELTMMKPPISNKVNVSAASVAAAAVAAATSLSMNNELTDAHLSRKAAQSIYMYKRKYRQRQQQQAAIKMEPSTSTTTSTTTTTTNTGTTSSTDVISSDILIPRERVISICNLDKDALDDYLIEGNNSQEQEAELLKYFHNDDNSNSNESHPQQNQQQYVSTTGHRTTTSNSNNNFSNIIVTAPIPTVAPITVIATTSRGDNRTFTTNKNVDQISELRQYLHQSSVGIINRPATIDTARQMISGNATIYSDHHGSSNIATAFAFNSRNEKNPRKSGNIMNSSTASTVTATSQTKESKRKLISTPAATAAATATANYNKSLNYIPQSPNTRRKNFSFVPISPGPQSPRSAFTFQNTVVPRRIHIGSSSSTSTTTAAAATSSSALHQSAIHRQFVGGATTSIDNYPSSSSRTFQMDLKDEMSFSAPSSPSLFLQSMQSHANRYNFQTSVANNHNNTITTTGINSNINNGNNNLSSTAIAHNNYLECRSQSVPLHRQSPAYNTDNRYDNNYSYSVCNSVSQTPVPPEYNDFNDNNFLNALTDTSIDDVVTSIKMEADTNNRVSVDLTSILYQSGLQQSSAATTTNFNVSRSVPSTPQPFWQSQHLLQSQQHQRLQNQHHHHHQHHQNISEHSNDGGSNGASMLRKIHSMDISKSVPTTPIDMCNNMTPFRYSPDQNRDFLINGNTVVDSCLTASPFYNHHSSTHSTGATTISSIQQQHQLLHQQLQLPQHQQQQQLPQQQTHSHHPSIINQIPNILPDDDNDTEKSLPIPEVIDEITTFGDDDPIIGSDLLGNL